MSLIRPAVRTLVIVLALAVASGAAAQTAVRLTGTVVDASGGAVPGASVTLHAAPGGSPQTVTTDASGAFAFAAVAVGRYTLDVRQPLFEIASIAVEVGESAPPPLRITLRVGGVQEAVNVSGRGYRPPPATTSATKTETPLLETPFAIQVVPQALMADQLALRLKDALKNVSGVTQMGEYSYDGFQVRGFTADGNTTVYRDGLRIRRGRTETAELSSVEVLKGPAGSLYGRIEPGGLINLVPVRPSADPAYTVDVQAGSYNFWRAAIGATGALNAGKTLLYRADVVARKHDTFVDGAYDNRLGLYPSLTWRPSTRTEVNVNAEIQRDRSRYWTGVPVVGTTPADIPISTFLGFGTSDNEYQHHDKTLVGANWSHRFGQNWKVTQRFHAYRLDYVFANTWYGTSMAADNRTLSRGMYTAPLDVRNTWATNLDLTGTLRTGSLTHRLLVGVDHFDEDFEQELYSGAALAAFGPTIDILAPTYRDVPSMDAVPLTSFSKFRHHWNGVYAQDQITILPQLQVLVGGRYDDATRRGASSPTSIADAGTRAVSVKNSAFSPRVGVVVRPTPQISIYGNYVESMGAPNSGLGRNGETFDPETAQQVEGGVKAELFGARLVASAAVYDLKKQNVLQTDPANPAFRIAIGETASTGVEFDVAGQLSERFTITASYAHANPRIVTNSANVGNRLAQAPRNSGNVWGRYQFAGALHNASVGLGVMSVGQRFGTLANRWSLPAFTRVDAMVALPLRVGARTVTLQLNAENLLDEVYYLASDGGVMALPGAPRSLTLSVRTAF